MSAKNKLFLALVAIIGWSIIGYFAWQYFNKPKQNEKKPFGRAEYDTLVQPTHYKKIPLQSFKCVVLNCDLGPVKVYLEASEKPAIQFHQSFMKYVTMDFKGDTLVIHTQKTPKSTPQSPIYRQIYVYAPDLKYYRAEGTESLLTKFKINELKIESRSSSVRIFDCDIKNLQLYTNHACNYLIDADNSVDKIYAEINPNSAFACRGYVGDSFTLKCQDMTNIELDRQAFKKMKVINWK